MTRVIYLGLVVAFALSTPIRAQQNDPPKNFTNSLGMTFVWIPPGKFMMGSPNDEKERFDNEARHKVTVSKGFYMAVSTVTQEQWYAVMGSNPSAFKGERNLPVESVSWQDCQEFCKKLREKDKVAYRLPSEAEWEYCCRAGATTPFHSGENISAEQANYNANYIYDNGKRGVFRRKTMPVGSFPANAWGLYDMHGNVWQWCEDWFDDYPTEKVFQASLPGEGTHRVMRGGAWNFSPVYCRSACRGRAAPDTRNNGCGLRVCFFAE